MFSFPALEDDPGDGEPHEEQVQYEVLAPGEPPDDTTTGTGDIGKGMEKDNERITRKEPHQGQGAVESDHSCSFEDQGQGKRYFAAGDGPGQDGCPGIGQRLVVQLFDEGAEIEEFAEAGIQEKQYV